MASKYILEGSVYGPKHVFQYSYGGDGKYNTDGSLRWNNWRCTRFNQTALPVSDISSDLFGRYVQAGGAVNDPFQYITGTLINKAQNKLVSSIKSVDWNAGIALAEGEKAVALLRETSKKLAGVIIDLRYGNFKAAARRLKARVPSNFYDYPRSQPLSIDDVFSFWLELQYGWKPLLSDIYDSMNAFAESADKPRVREGRTSSSREVEVNVSQSPSLWGAFGPCRATVRYQYRYVEELPLARSLGLLDPLSVLWERLPFSFIVDWFLPIGSYLENLNTIPYLKGDFLTTYVVKHHYITTPGSDPDWNARARGCVAVGNSVAISRFHGGVSETLPSFKTLPEAMSPLHVANAVALIGGALSGRPRRPNF